eukprot:443099_1
MPILKYTCNQNKTWINSINKITYNLPDQLAEQPIGIPDDVTLTTSHQTKTTQDVKRWMSESVSVGLLHGMFSASQTVSQAYEVITSSTRLWGTVNSSISSFKVNFIPYEIAPNMIRLSDLAQNYIDQTIKTEAPEFNVSTVEVYETFFKYFGTHVFTTADTGGAFHLRYETDKYLLTQMSSQTISEQGGISFGNYLKASGAVSGGQNEVDKRFTSMSTIITTCKGGSFCPNAQSNDYSQWQISVASAPWIMAAKFIHVATLIDDAQIAKNFISAVLNHEQISYLLNEIQPNIAVAKDVIQKGIRIEYQPPTVKGNSNTRLNTDEWMEKCVTTVCNNDNDLASCKKQAPGLICNDWDLNHHVTEEPGRNIYSEKDTFHSYITDNNMKQLNDTLYNKQAMVLQQLQVIQYHVEMLLRLPLIQNQTLFNQTAALWENTLLFTESEYAWETAAYSAHNSLCYRSGFNCDVVSCPVGYSWCGG